VRLVGLLVSHLLLVLQIQVCMLSMASAEKVEEFTQLVEQYKPKK
jgi:hypothetical protein